MSRINSEGIPREDLLFALRTPRMVSEARRIDSCLLCRNRRVNEAGLCDVCYTMLDGEEFRLVGRWLSGEGP
jgi:hypothetical protein